MEYQRKIHVNGMISQDNADNTTVRDIFEENRQVADFYGKDPQGPPPNEFDLGSVEVPDKFQRPFRIVDLIFAQG